MLRFSMILSIFLAFSVSASAQSSKYSSWSDPSNPKPTENSATFAEKLHKLIDDAEKAKAADPVFLKDLRALANSYAAPSLSVVLSDSFDDGDFTKDPTWQVLSGDYFIEKGWGLRNKVAQTGQSSQSSTQLNSGEDVAIAIFGSILQQATGAKNKPAAPAQPTENAIATPVKISNAFSMSMSISSWLANGHFEAGVFQGNDASTGYRLVYKSGRPLDLIKVGSQGRTSIAQSNAAQSIEDKKFHDIVWSRGHDGMMTVSIDGAEIIRVADTSFSDPFDGVRISDQGGDFIIKKITVSGS